MIDWNEISKRDEPLHPDLREALVTTDFGMRMVQHPLVHTLYSEGLDAVFNEQYRLKRKAVAEYEAEGNWSALLNMYARPYRAETLWAFESRMTDEEYWGNVAWVWIDSENIGQLKWLWELMLQHRSPESRYRHIMTDDERAALGRLGRRFTIYRGARVGDPIHSPRGLSWTTNPRKARFFANRYAKVDRDGTVEEPGVVLSFEVDRDDVIAHFLQRGEEEIVVLRRTIPDEAVRAAGGE